MSEKGISQKTARTVKANEAKWGKTLLSGGWSMIPNTLIERQRALGLDALDINILLHLIRHWWDAGNLPHPGKKSIAEAIGVHPRTVQKRIAALEKDDLIQRIERRTPEGSRTNLYDFSGLIDAATPYAKEKALEIKRRQEDDKSRVSRKGKAKLTLVEGPKE